MKLKYDFLLDDDFPIKINVPRYWPMLSYAGEERVPPAIERAAGSWPTYYLRRDENGRFIDLDGNPIAFSIRQPDANIDFSGEQLETVREVLENLTPHQIEIAKYWGTGPPTKQFTPIIDILIDTYKVSAPRAARILAVTQAAINDALVVAWHYKYLWNIARPNQLDQTLETSLATPYHPSYPAGHSTVAGCTQVVLSYFFTPESDRLKELAEECAMSRLYAGVHFPVDNEEGLRLGRHIGSLVVAQLMKEFDKDMTHIDKTFTQNSYAELPPPPYKQVIPYIPKY